MQCELDAQTRHSLAALAYKEWTIWYDILKKTKEEKDDGSPDWKELHQARMKDAEENLRMARHVSDSIMPYSPLVKGE